MTSTIDRSETHATFVIERTYPVPLPAVWHALSDSDARDMWFGGGSAFDASEKTHDFRVGGGAVEDGRWRDGPTSRFESTYTDIVEHRRLVFTYDLWVDGRHLSTSLTTIVVEPDGESTRLTYTEQAVHFDGLDTVDGREEGTRGLLDNLGTYLVGGG
ncbi:MAG TPA: SRPBCC family protein [Acidimicrobiales bacterium]|nr:SRPBCC family protein [Acidimicrobiales bacterium]